MQSCDTLTDIPECKSATKNDCDLENGYCLDDIEGLYTCHCNPGFEEDQGSQVHECVGK